MSARTVTGTVMIQTNRGWFAADFKDVALRESQQSYADDGTTFSMNDFVAPLLVQFARPVSVLYEYISDASTSGETLLGWDKEGTVSCAPTGRPDPKRRSGLQTPDSPPLDTRNAEEVKARVWPMVRNTACDQPFSLARITKIALAQYPPLLMAAANTDLPKGASIVVVALNSDASILDAWLWESSGTQALDQAAIDAAKKTTYAPARAFCDNVPSYYFMKVRWGY